MKTLTKNIAMVALSSLLMLTLSSCGSTKDITTVPSQPVTVAQSAPETLPVVENVPSQAEPEAMPAAESDSGRQDGERFLINIPFHYEEDMEEPVSYEHVKNDVIGIELDYDYKNFVRRSGPASECFISCYDNADSPENYLELIYSEENADSAAASIAESLSQSYNITRGTRTLTGAGTCAFIDASADKNNQTPDHLQAVYVIPLNNGCVIATMHYSFEAADGFGRRFSEIMNTLKVMAGR